jgi:hypothetical protein
MLFPAPASVNGATWRGQGTDEQAVDGLPVGNGSRLSPE